MRSEHQMLGFAALVKLQNYCMGLNPPILWREDRSHDYGLDGEIEFTRKNEGNIVPTGKIVKVIVKATSRVFENNIKIQLRTKELEYCNNADFLTMLFFYDSHNDDLYFKPLKGIEYNSEHKVKTICFEESDKLVEKSDQILNATIYDGATSQKDVVRVSENESAPVESYHLQLVQDLKSCVSGTDGWKKYEEICTSAVDFIFQRSFRNYHRLVQSKSSNGKDIKDLVIPNRSNARFWDEVRDDYQARNIIFEFKNYTKKIGKGQLIQVSHYLKKKSYGRFAIVICREGLSKSGVVVQKELLRDDDKMIIVLSDDDLVELAKIRVRGGEPETVLEHMKTDLELSL